jgi:hypothetical protein
MKKLVLCALMALTCGVGFAQKKINEGIITYKVDYNAAASNQMAAMMPTEIKVFFKENLTCVVSDGKMFSTRFIMDAKTEAQRLLLDIPMMSKKFSVRFTPDEIETMKESFPDLTFTEGTETKSIASFTGKKYSVFNKTNSQTYEGVFTKDIDVPANALNQYFDKRYGFPLEFTSSMQGTMMKLLVQEVKEEKVPEAIFKPGDEYEEITFSQLREMRGGK